jgi:hypothetical protein
VRGVNYVKSFFRSPNSELSTNILSDIGNSTRRGNPHKRSLRPDAVPSLSRRSPNRKSTSPPRKRDLCLTKARVFRPRSSNYDPTSIINEVRSYVDAWRQLSPSQWQVSPENGFERTLTPKFTPQGISPSGPTWSALPSRGLTWTTQWSTTVVPGYRHSSTAAQRKRKGRSFPCAASDCQSSVARPGERAIRSLNGSSGVGHRVEARPLGCSKWLSHFDVDPCSFQFSSVPAWMPRLETASLEEVAHDYTRQPSSQTA